MRFFGFQFAAWSVIVALFAGPAAAADPGGAEFFETKVRPLLAEKCLACHGEARMNGLRLDHREGFLSGGERGPAIRPGDPENSLLIQAVRHALPKLQMPPGGSLDEAEISALETWIRSGAPWPKTSSSESSRDGGAEPAAANKFWSLQPVRNPEPPAVRNAGWVRNRVDRFILARLEQEDLEPAPAADKRTLIRRATFDLIGLPPTPDEVAAFIADDSPAAFAKVVARLLDSPHYGERWGRYWLDLARYADGLSGAKIDDPLPNAFRYRDWVVRSFNEDLPYDRFVTAQLAADFLPQAEREKHFAALGFHALRGRDDDRVDVTGRVFLGLTVGCAQCHDHKYDPIPTEDFYSWQGVFASSEPWELPLAPDNEVQAYKKAQEEIAQKEIEIKEFIDEQSNRLIDILIAQTGDYLTAAWRVHDGRAAETAAAEEGLDAETLDRWIAYLDKTDREHRYLDEWDVFYRRGGSHEEAKRLAGAFADTLMPIHREKRAIDDRNYVKLGGREGARTQKVLLNTNLDFIEPKKWYLWRDLCSEPFSKDGYPFEGGVLYYGEKKIERFLSPLWHGHLERLRAELDALKAALPAAYPFIHGYRDAEEPKDVRVAIRGDAENLGEAAPRRFLRALSDGEPKPFEHGSGRLELAEAITSPKNPLTARVMVNRIWQFHFGRGIVETPSNFGRNGERPTHPELLDYLAAKFVESGWSAKAMHREIMLSATYQLSSRYIDRNYEKDAGNRWYWRANLRKRLDAESLRDAMLAVAGNLDRRLGGPPEPLADDNERRTVYGTISRTEPDRTMALFDFPDPKTSAASRSLTLGPLQRLYFLNNSFVVRQAKSLAERLEREAGASAEDKVRHAYELLFSRPPEKTEVAWALEYVQGVDDGWTRYAQSLLASAAFSSLN